MKLSPQEFADKHLGKYKLSNGNIITKYCPFCNGGQHNDKWTFGVSLDNGAYNCFRGKCGAKGSFYDLHKHFNENYEFDDDKYNQSNYRHHKPKKKTYKKPKVDTNEVNDKIKKYLKKRCFSVETINKCDIKEKDGNVVYEYYKNKELVLVKYKTPDDKKKIWCEKGGKPVLWMMDKCSYDKPLIITEGEYDAMAVVESGFDNVVSVPFGAKDYDWIDHCWSFLEKFKKIIIWSDNDEAGKEMKEEIIPRLGKWRCYTVKSKYKDANIHLYKDGKESVRKAVENADEVPIDRVINLADVKQLDLSKIEASKSFLGQLNKLLGGYMMGYISIWTGANASGKSTYLNLEMLESIQQGYGAGVYSGELREDLFQYWINLQAAGPEHFRSKMHSIKEEMVPYVKKDVRNKITNWYNKKLFYYDIQDTSKPEKILEAFENLYRRYGIKQFFIDNLMTIEYGGSKSEYYHRQSGFVTKCKNFASRLNVHVHIVAHPKKPKKGERITKEDIAGLYEITNKADNVLVMHRIDDDNKKEFPESIQVKLKEAKAKADDNKPVNINAIDILKSRIYGWQKVTIPLGFEPNTKRFYHFENEQKKFKSYGWEDDNNLE